MREAKKKTDAGELLATRKPAAKSDPDMAGRDRGGMRAPALDKEEFDLMKKRLASAKGAGEKRDVLAEIQRRFGNDKAGQVVKEMRLNEDDDMPSRPKPKAPGKEKG